MSCKHVPVFAKDNQQRVNKMLSNWQAIQPSNQVSNESVTHSVWMLASGRKWARMESAASWTRRRPPVLLTADTPHDNPPGGCSSHPQRCWRRFRWSLVSGEENRHSASVYLNTWSFNLLTTRWRNIPSAWFCYFSQSYSQQSLWCFLPQETPGFPL